MHVAIVGAGIAGLTAARQCQAQGHHVTIYEKSSGVSGRMSTRQTELGGFDHGAQYFTANTDRFKKETDDWMKLGWVAPWSGKLANLNKGISSTANKDKKRFVPIPGMSALGKQLAHGLDVRLEQQVMNLEAHEGKWLLNVKSEDVPVNASAGPFDAVIIAVPPAQAHALLEGHSSIAKQVGDVKMEPCWALMLGFQTPLNLPFDGAWVSDSRLGWIARDTSKPDHRAGERWVCHATHAWSVEHLEDDVERAQNKLSKAFHEATGSPIQAIYTVAHRWRYAQSSTPIQGTCLWDSKQKIGVCGDWFAAGLEGAGRVENAFLSGLDVAGKI